MARTRYPVFVEQLVLVFCRHPEDHDNGVPLKKARPAPPGPIHFDCPAFIAHRKTTRSPRPYCVTVCSCPCHKSK